GNEAARHDRGVNPGLGRQSRRNGKREREGERYETDRDARREVREGCGPVVVLERGEDLRLSAPSRNGQGTNDIAILLYLGQCGARIVTHGLGPRSRGLPRMESAQNGFRLLTPARRTCLRCPIRRGAGGRGEKLVRRRCWYRRLPTRFRCCVDLPPSLKLRRTTVALAEVVRSAVWRA